jgi:EpsI family protein
VRWFVAAFAVAVALVTNGLRVAVIGVMSYKGLTGTDIHGPMHAAQGLSVAVVGFIIVFAAIQLLARRAALRRAPDTEVHVAETGQPAVRGNRLVPKLAVVVSLALLATAGVGAIRQPAPIPPRIPLAQFPTVLAGWHAQANTMAPAFVRNSGADEEVSRVYAGPSARVIRLYVGYFHSQLQAKELGTERMADLEGRGAAIQLRQNDGGVTHAREVVEATTGGRHYILYWYDLGGRSTTNRYALKAWTIWRLLAHARNDGAVIVLTADVPAGHDPAAVAADTRELARLTAATLRAHFER